MKFWKNRKEAKELINRTTTDDVAKIAANILIKGWKDERKDPWGYRKSPLVDKIKRMAEQKAAEMIACDITTEFKEKILNQVLEDEITIEALKGKIREEVRLNLNNTRHY